MLDCYETEDDKLKKKASLSEAEEAQLRGILFAHNKIIVADNGCGMTAQQTEQIFFPFVTYKPGGTGLGLAVTRQIIEAHHGTLRVESVPGEGTIFYILLPLG